MNRLLPRLLACVLALSSLPALAHDYRLGDLEIRHPWARPTRPGQPHAGGYLEVRNLGRTEDRLVGVKVPAQVAARGELHTMRMEDNVMRMRQVENMRIPAGGRIALQPGGDHLMLIDVRRPLAAGEKVQAVLVFERAGEITVDLNVEERKPAAAEARHDHHHDHGAAPKR